MPVRLWPSAGNASRVTSVPAAPKSATFCRRPGLARLTKSPWPAPPAARAGAQIGRGDGVSVGSRRGPRRPWSERERALLDELERIFFAEGFAHLSMADLAARLRVSRTTLYRLAPGKQNLVELVVDRMFNQMGKTARAALAE